MRSEENACLIRPLCENCPKTEFFSRLNTEKYVPEKTPNSDSFHTLTTVGDN